MAKELQTETGSKVVALLLARSALKDDTRAECPIKGRRCPGAGMRKSSDLVVKSESARGTKTTDTYSLKGIAQALDKVAEECK